MVGILVLLSAVSAQSDYEIRRCEKLDPSDPCLRNLAVARSDDAICKLIGSVSTRNSCYSKIADNTGDKSLCMNIRKNRGTLEDKYECYEDFITGIEDRDFCIYDLKGDEEAQDECFSRIAGKENNVVLCDDLSLEDSQMDCILDIASELQDTSLCQLIRTKIDLKRCKAQGGKGCDTRDEIVDAAYECESKITVGKRRSICRSRSRQQELNLDEDEEQDLNFRGYDDPVYLKYKGASLAIGVGVFDVTIGARTRELTLQPGMTGEYRFVNVYMLDLVERGTEEEPEEPRMVLCVYPDPVPRIPTPKEEPVKEEPEPIVEEPEPIIEEPEEVEDVPEAIVAAKTRPTFFQWLGGLFGSGASFLKKILV